MKLDLLSILAFVIKYYDELKSNKNLLDYDDLINKTNKLLKIKL